MRKKISNMLAVMLLLQTSAFSQLEKGTWLVGGSGSFGHYTQSFRTEGYEFDAKYTEIEIRQTVGYFLASKFAAGLRPYFSQNLGDPFNTGNTNLYSLGIGPFIRYYLLNNEKNTNLFVDIDGFMGINRQDGGTKLEKGNFNGFSTSAGIEAFFNSSIGVNMSIGYQTTTASIDNATNVVNNYTRKNKGIFSSIGLIAHLNNH